MSESPTPRLTIGTGALAGGLAGALVGFGDGIRAALLVGTGLRLALATAALAASVDAVLGVGVGAAVELVGRIAVWGRRARAPGWARVVAFLLAGGAAAAAAAAAVAMTAQRHNRFLAAGLTALAALAAAIGGVVLAPAAARVLAAGQARPEPMPAPGPAAILLSPLAVAVLGAVIFFPLAQTRWLAGAALTHHTFMAAAPALLLPLALAMLAELRLPIRWRPALLLATLVYGGVAAFAIARA